MTLRALLPAALLLGLAACRQPGPQVPRPYTAAEEGLTLVYLNPSLPGAEQAARRLQVRVDRVADREDGAQVVFKSFTVGTQPPFQATFVVKGDGVGLLSPDGKAETAILPAGFPEGAQSWTRGEVVYRILGRAAWSGAASVLPEDRREDGIWVEARTAQGALTRTLYLPGLGEVQSDERAPSGAWVTVNRLVQYGFTELPASAAPAPEAAPAPTHPTRTRKARKG